MRSRVFYKLRSDVRRGVFRLPSGAPEARALELIGLPHSAAEELDAAEEGFLTSALVGIMPLTEVDGSPVGT